jgi:hypothetical protein
MDTTFTPVEFNQQVTEFRKLMGDKSFWALPSEKRGLAQKALGHVYLSLAPGTSKAEIDRCAEVLKQTFTEYTSREITLLSIGGKIGA